VLRSFWITAVVFLVLLVVVFIWAIPVVIYQDHEEIVSANKNLAKLNSTLKSERDDWKARAEKLPKSPAGRSNGKPLASAPTESPCGSANHIEITRNETFVSTEVQHISHKYGVRLTVTLPVCKISGGCSLIVWFNTSVDRFADTGGVDVVKQGRTISILKPSTLLRTVSLVAFADSPMHAICAEELTQQ
jgi:hypothetical protein